MNINFDKLIKRAFKNIEKPESNQKHFSFVMYGNKIISEGWNSSIRTHPLAFRYGYEYPFVHSELDAIAKLPYKVDFLRKCAMVNVRIGRRNNVLLSRPCRSCQKVIMAFNIGSCFYSNEYSNFEKLEF